jgi:transposase, IS6 family
MAERGLSLDHSTAARWVLRYAPELSKRIRRHLRRPGGSWRVDETYVRVAGRGTYLYRALDSEGNTIDFMLSPKRDNVAAKHFLQLALWRSAVRPRVINVDGHPAYAHAVSILKESGELGPRCRCRPVPYLNNIAEQDHRFIKKRIAASLWFRSVQGAVNYDSRIRIHEHDPERASEMAGQGGCNEPSSFHSRDLRHRCVARGGVNNAILPAVTYLRQIRKSVVSNKIPFTVPAAAGSTCPTGEK